MKKNSAAPVPVPVVEETKTAYKQKYRVVLTFEGVFETEEEDEICHYLALAEKLKTTYPNARIGKVEQKSEYDRYDVTDEFNKAESIRGSLAILTISKEKNSCTEYTLKIGNHNGDDGFSFFDENQMKEFIKRHDLKVMVPYAG